MKRWLGSLVLFVATASAVLAADVVFKGATVFPSPDVPPIVDALVLVRDGTIVRVGPASDVAIAPDAVVVDCTGQFITAGFWNSHVHILTPRLLQARASSAEALNAEIETMFTRWGFTTVFDLASAIDNTLALRERIERGELRGPRVLTVGEPLWTEIPIYVRDFLAAQHLTFPTVHTADEAVAQVRAQTARGVDGVKVFAGSVQRGPVANMSPDLVRSITAEAHGRHLPVFSHPQNTAGLEASIAGGVDILAHTALESPPWTPHFVQRLKRANIALIPTLTLFDSEARSAGLPPAEVQRWIGVAVDELRAFAAGGGEVLFGTDIGYISQYDTTEELRLMARAGMTFPAILASLTTNPAARFGRAKQSGRVAPGFDADLVVLDQNPAENITALAHVRRTVRRGQIIYSSSAAR